MNRIVFLVLIRIDGNLYLLDSGRIIVNKFNKIETMFSKNIFHCYSYANSEILLIRNIYIPIRSYTLLKQLLLSFFILLALFDNGDCYLWDEKSTY